MKRCTECNKLKELPLFSKCTAKNDGLSPHCKECVSEYNKRYYRLKTDKIKQNVKNYYAKNKDNLKEKTIIRVANWRKNNKGRYNSIGAKYRATKLQATPKWLTKSQLAEIEQFYKDAAYLTQLTGTCIEVDHITPLQGKNSSGLHVPWNLQLLTASENSSKGNRV